MGYICLFIWAMIIWARAIYEEYYVKGVAVT